MRLRRYLFMVLLALPACLQAQITAFVNNRNEVMVWDRGMVHKIDFLAPTLIKKGRIAIPYLDNTRSFKIYYNGGVRPVNIGFTNMFYATDNLITYLNQKALNVFDRGVSRTLTMLCEEYFVGDSLVLYLDGVKSDYKVYYNGKIQSIESYLADSTLSGVKVTDNIIAYNNFANQFRIFYHGDKVAQEDYPVISFDAGRNTVAYVDANRKFKIFHNGQTFNIDNFPPQSYYAGDNLVAFVSSDGYFKIFYGDSVQTFGYFNQQPYKVADNLVAFRDPSGYFKVFYKGTVTDMENYWPNDITIQYNSLAYTNYNNTLRMFSEGEVYDVTNAELSNWDLSYDVITYQIGQGIFKVFYKGQEY